MNVFYLHPDPTVCAQMHIDKHVVKMAIEYAQILSTAHRVVDGDLWYGRTTNGRKIARWFHPDYELNMTLYKATHPSHPSTVWARSSEANYTWLFDMWTALCSEYTYRYNKTHESFRKLEHALLIPPLKIEKTGFTQPPPAMKDFSQCIVEGNSIESYRNYYWEAKRPFAKWTTREIPRWWIDKHNEWKRQQA